MKNTINNSSVRLRNSLLGILDIKGYRQVDQQTDERSIVFNKNEVKKYYPELVDENDEIDYKGFIPILIESINELNQKISIIEKEKIKRKYQRDYNKKAGDRYDI